MSDQIREQVSAFLDGELPESETELLLKRLTRDADLRESFGRYALIGESMRGSSRAPSVSRGFAARVNRAIDGEPATAVREPQKAAATRWWRPVGMAAVAAGVAAVAVVALQERAVSPGGATSPITAQNVVMSSAVKPASREAISYTTPAATSGVRVPGTRLTSYVFAHSNFVSGLGQGNVMSGLLSDPDDLPPAAHEVEDASLRPVVNDAVATQPRDPRIAP
jgi:sigma-E factor negative regulatory protein RseA